MASNTANDLRQARIKDVYVSLVYNFILRAAQPNQVLAAKPVFVRAPPPRYAPFLSFLLFCLFFCFAFLEFFFLLCIYVNIYALTYNYVLHVCIVVCSEIILI